MRPAPLGSAAHCWCCDLMPELALSDDPFHVIEWYDLPRLRALLDGGLDPNTTVDSWTLLHAAIDIEFDSHIQSATRLHVDATTLLVARGADPDLAPPGQQSPRTMARQCDHWLATEVFERLVPPARSRGADL